MSFLTCSGALPVLRCDYSSYTSAVYSHTHVYLLFVAIHNTIAEYMTSHSLQHPAPISRLHLIEFPAIADHPWLDRRGCRGRRPSARSDRPQRQRHGRGEANGSNTHVVARPQPRTVRIDVWIHSVELIEADAIGSSNVVASIAHLDQVEAIAVCDHAGLHGGGVAMPLPTEVEVGLAGVGVGVAVGLGDVAAPPMMPTQT
jgi:hypothetical protein